MPQGRWLSTADTAATLATWTIGSSRAFGRVNCGANDPCTALLTIPAFRETIRSSRKEERLSFQRYREPETKA